MNLAGLLNSLTGKGGPFEKILKAIAALEKALDDFDGRLSDIEANELYVRKRLDEVKTQLDRIEEEIGADEAVTLGATLGTPQEQS
jgi:predicted  nucleic acid-binding Zn-ribbon protein